MCKRKKQMKKNSIGIIGMGWVGSSVAISLPSLISEKGVEEVLALELSETENDKFQHSVKVLKDAILEVENSENGAI